MKIRDLLRQSSIRINTHVSDKDQAIDTLVHLMDQGENLSNVEEYKQAIYAREALSTTGIGESIAIPHAQSSTVIKPGLAAMVVPEGVDYDSLDQKPAKLFFMIAVPQTGGNDHLKILALLSTMLMDQSFKDNLIQAQSEEAFLDLIDQKEKEQIAKENALLHQKDHTFQLLGVTACPTGIAHTYMAAEALSEKAKEMGITIKVETNGSGGTKNALTKKEIEACDAIIVAADKNIDMARFDGKPVVIRKVSDGINKTQALIEEAMSGKAPIYQKDANDKVAENDEESENIGRQIYKHLMNGVSHMLPFVIGGGILIALAFLFDDYSIDPANFGKNTEFARFFKEIGDMAFGFMLPILSGYIAMSIADRPGLAVGFVGGALASAGGSGFLGALIAGFAAGYLIVALRKLFAYLPDSLEGIKPVLLYPLLGILLMALIMKFGINPPVAAINQGLSDFLNSMNDSSKVILGLILGGMMAIDMGGPLNKAAYVFGTASIVSGNYDIMAAVMIGGMVPPLAIALCTIFFKNRFTKKERQTAPTNIIMGLSFITEGAIPFAAADPLHVIPACAIGASIAGALSMLFGCALRAPHGGIFVLPVISNPLGYFSALAIGAIVGMLILAILKKPLKSAE